MSLGFILSEFCVYFTNFDVVPRGSREALSASMKDHPEILPNLSSLMFKLKSSLGSQTGESVSSSFLPKNLFCALFSCYPVEKQTIKKADCVLHIETVFTRKEVHLQIQVNFS